MSPSMASSIWTRRSSSTSSSQPSSCTTDPGPRSTRTPPLSCTGAWTAGRSLVLGSPPEVAPRCNLWASAAVGAPPGGAPRPWSRVLHTGCQDGHVATKDVPTERPQERPAVIHEGLPTQLPDIDPEETQEWLESLDRMIDDRGRERARYVMLKLLERSREKQVGVPALRSTDYINTIPPEREPWFPGDEDVERRIRAFIRWNAAVMVSDAN